MIIFVLYLAIKIIIKLIFRIYFKIINFIFNVINKLLKKEFNSNSSSSTKNIDSIVQNMRFHDFEQLLYNKFLEFIERNKFLLEKYLLLPILIVVIWIIYYILIYSSSRAQWFEAFCTFCAVIISLDIHSKKSKPKICVNNLLNNKLSIELMNESKSSTYIRLSGVYLVNNRMSIPYSDSKYSSEPSTMKSLNCIKCFLKFFSKYDHYVPIDGYKTFSLILKSNSSDKRLNNFIHYMVKLQGMPSDRLIMIMSFTVSDHIINKYKRSNPIWLSTYM